jgi:hypothetical protein
MRGLPLSSSIFHLAAAALIALPADAGQRQLGALQGTVRDQTGGVLPGATVTVTQAATGEIRTAITNESGIFRVPSLDAGRYSVTVTLTGFGAVEYADVRVSVGATLGLDVTMAPGAIAREVLVTPGSSDIQTERADVSYVAERRRIADLPIAGRNPLHLATLQPGVIGLPGGSDFLAQEQGLAFNAGGQRTSANSALVDGLSINSGPWGGTVLFAPSSDAVEELEVIASNASVEFGRNSGAALNLVTRGGTNELRGSAMFLHRSNDLRARTFFEDAKDDFFRNDLGISLGGPIRREVSFFFVSVNGARESSGTSQQFTVETEQFRDFVMRTRPDSNAAYLLNKFRPPVYPTENLRDLGSPAPGVLVIGPPDGIPDVGTINHTITSDRSGDQFSARVDRVFRGGHDKLRASYYLSRLRPEFAHLRSAFNHPFPHRSQFLNASHSRVVSDQTVNEIAIGYTRLQAEAGDPTPDAPTITIAGISGQFGIEFWHPIAFSQNNLELKNTLKTSRGRHGIRLGGELRLSFDTSELHHWERPTYTFSAPPGVPGSSGILDFADDEAFSERRAVDPSTGLSTFAYAKFRGREFALFIQDNWKVRPHVALTLGLRYEVFLSPRKVADTFSGILLGPGATRQEQIQNARIGTVDRLFDADWNNLGPRVGLAWDVGGNGHTVARAGGGIAYNRINLTVWDDRLNPPRFANAFADARDPIPIVYSLGPDFQANPALGRGLDERGGIQGARVDLQVIDPQATVPYSYSWFAGVQRQLPWQLSFEANYIGTAARNLMNFDGPNGEDYNRFAGDMADGVRDRLNPSFGAVRLAESRINANYHGLTAQLHRRFSQGVSFQASYTLGHAQDHPGSAEEVSDPGRDYGSAAFDVRHNLALNAIWRSPCRVAAGWQGHLLCGWQLNAVTVWRSGTPFTVTCGNCDFNLDGVDGDRLHLPVFGTRLPRFTREQWLAGALVASDFPRPSPGELGTLPRNAYYGPGYFSADVSMFKDVSVSVFGARPQTLQLRVEAYNVFNTVNLGNPNVNVANVNFGRVTTIRTPGGGLPGARLIQLAARLSF